jgi:hypothetical protein
MKKETKEKLQSMQMTDVYSLLLFALYKIKDLPEYSTLSEMAYIMDGDSLFKFMEYFGGKTIRIPTLAEFKVVVEALLLYQYVNLEGISYNQALKLLDTSEASLKDIKNCYASMVEILNTYNIAGK